MQMYASEITGFADFLKTVPDSPGVTLDRESIGVGEVMAHV